MVVETKVSDSSITKNLITKAGGPLRLDQLGVSDASLFCKMRQSQNESIMKIMVLLGDVTS